MAKGDPIKRYCAELCWTNKQKSGSTLKASMPLPVGVTDEQQTAVLNALAIGLQKTSNANAAVSFTAVTLAKMWPTLVRSNKAASIAEWARGQAGL